MRIHHLLLCARFCVNLSWLFLSLDMAFTQPLIQCGVAQTGTIRSAGKIDLYSFTLSNVDVIEARITKTSGNLAPKLELLGPQGNVIQTSTSGLLTGRPTTTGVHQFRVSDATSTGTGNYEFTFQMINNPCNKSVISCGQIVRDSTNTLTAMNAYTFSATAGDRIRIRSAETANTSGAFTPRLALYSPAGVALTVSSTGDLNANITLTGNHTLLITDASSTGTGDYEFTLQNSRSPCNIIPVAECQVVRASINTPAGLGIFAFNGTGGQTAVLRVQGVTTLFTPLMDLYDPDGMLIKSSSTTVFTISQLLSKTGRHTVIVSAPAGTGMTGNYLLSLGNANVSLVTPNGGETFLAGAELTIAWESLFDDPNLVSFEVQLSTDGGASYPNVIFSGPATKQSFDWYAPPNLGATRGRMRVIAKHTNGQVCQDTSDADFTILTPAMMKSTTYKYDELNRLVQVNYDDGAVIVYSYDATGNRLTETVTLSTALPTVTTVAAAPVTSTSAILNGSINPNGASTSASFEYSTSSTLSPVVATPVQQLAAENTTLAFSVNVSGLVPNTTYYYRIVGTNNAGTVKGTILSFTTLNPLTLALAPAAQTIFGGESRTMTATLSAPQPLATTVTLASANNTIAQVPSAVIIPAGAMAASFAVKGNSPGGPVIITATLPPSLGSVSTNASVSIAPGYEADVAPRGNINGTVTTIDTVQIGRFVAGVDKVANGSEFQRADSAPIETLGDGLITMADYVQAARYAAGLDPLTIAGGPTSPQTSSQNLASLTRSVETEAQKRSVRVVKIGLTRGQTYAVAIELEARGNENALAFSLDFDPSQVSFVSATAANRGLGAMLQVNDSEVASGQVGIVLALPADQTFTARKLSVIIVTFTIPAQSKSGPATIAFGDQPVRREIVDAKANTMNATWQPGTITIKVK